MSLSGSNETASGSLELSVPTDLTVTSEADSEELIGKGHLSSKKHAKEVFTLKSDKQQLQKVVEKLRLELQGRDAQLLASKTRYESMLGQKESQYFRSSNEKQSKISHLESELASSNEELKTLKEKAGRELTHLLQKCQDFQENQSKLTVKQDEIKNSLQTLDVSEFQYERLKSKTAQELSLQEYASLRVYELVVPWKQKIKELNFMKSSFESNCYSLEKEVEELKKLKTKSDRDLNEARSNLVEYSQRCEDLRKEIKVDDFRIHNFDRVKKERDSYERDNQNLEQQNNELQFSSTVMRNEKQILEEKLSETKSKLRQCEQDLARYQSECFDTRSQLEKNKDDCMKTFSQLKVERERSDDLQEKFLKSRAELIAVFDDLRDSENEIKILKEKVTLTSKNETEFRDKFYSISKDYNKLTLEFDSLQNKCVKENDLLKEEINELRASYNSVTRNYANLQENHTRFQKDLEGDKYISMEKAMKNQDQCLQLQSEVHNLKRQLETYKSLETEYASTIRVFAAASSEDKGHPSIPAASLVQGRLSEDSISLTKRILELERQNAEACVTIRRLTTALNDLRTNLTSTKNSLNCAGQSSAQLLQKISSQGEQILSLEAALSSTNEIKDSLIKETNQLKAKLGQFGAEFKESKHLKQEFDLLRKNISDLRYSMEPVEHQLPSAIKISKGKTSIMNCAICNNHHKNHCIA